MKPIHTRRSFREALGLVGVRTTASKVNKSDFVRVFGEEALKGATYIQPEWVTLTELGLDVPAELLSVISEEEKVQQRIVSSPTVRLANYGTFLDQAGNTIEMRAMVYQYCNKFNPRNIHYAYKLFSNIHVLSQNASLRSVLEAEGLANAAAKEILKKFSDIGMRG